MASQRRRIHLLAYDIADPRRLARVHRCLKGWGIPLQYSVWLVPAGRADLDRLCAQLQALIVNAEDDVRIYALPTRPLVVTLGGARFQPGVLLLGETEPDRCVCDLLGVSASSAPQGWSQA
jgi:CRISPR-associated protein Cas2